MDLTVKSKQLIKYLKLSKHARDQDQDQDRTSRDQDQDQDQAELASSGLETKTAVSRTTTLP